MSQFCVELVWSFYIPHCGTSVWNMEFQNVELVWNSEFHINEKASEIKQCTGVHDHSSTICLGWALWRGMSLPFDSYTASAVERIDHLRLIHKLLTYLILTLETICVELVLTNRV